MHSKILQLTRQKIPMNKWIEYDKYFDGFVGEIADYTNACIGKDRRKVIENLKIPGCLIDTDNETVIVKSRAEYFEEKWKTFVEMAEDFSKWTLEDFMKNSFGPLNMYCEYNEKFSLYCDDTEDHGCLLTFDEWMRSVQDGQTFYIGGIVDYHF